MPSEITNIHVVVRGEVADAIVAFCRCVHNSRMFVREASQKDTVLFRLDELDMPVGRLSRGRGKAIGRIHLLSSCAVKYMHRLILRCRQQVLARVVETEGCIGLIGWTVFAEALRWLERRLIDQIRGASDRCSGSYVEMYQEAEHNTESTVCAARRSG